MENTKKLAQIMISVSIFLITLINTFLRNFDKDKADSLTLRYFILIGIYLIVYALISWKDIENKFLSVLLLVNLFLVGIVSGYISFIGEISTWDLKVQSIIIPLANLLLFLVFFIIPTMAIMVTVVQTYRKMSKNEKIIYYSLILIILILTLIFGIKALLT